MIHHRSARRVLWCSGGRKVIRGKWSKDIQKLVREEIWQRERAPFGKPENAVSCGHTIVMIDFFHICNSPFRENTGTIKPEGRTVTCG